MRWTGCVVLAGLISVSACHGPTIKEADPDGGSAGHAGSSGTAGTAGTAGGPGTAGTGGGSGTVGTGGTATGTGGAVAGSGGHGGQGGTAGTSANACSRCDTPCTDGVCDLKLIRASQSSSVQSSATSVALNDGRLYFVVGPGIDVSSIAAAGGPETELYPYHDCSNCLLSVAVDDADVFFAGQNVGGTNAILAVPKTGGDVRTVCTTPQALPGELTLEGDYVYYLRVDTGIERCPKAGGTTMHAISAGSAQSPNVVIRMSSRPGALIWGDRDTGVVTRVDTNGLTSQVVGVALNSGPTTYPVGVCDAIDDGTLAYWVWCAVPYNVYTEGASVNAPMQIAAGLGSGDYNATFDQYGSISLDSGYIYFTEAGFLDRVPKGGGTVQARARLRDGQGNPIKALIVGFDNSYVYLAKANMGDGAIYRVVK